jgi:hypothetical protein
MGITEELAFEDSETITALRAEVDRLMQTVLLAKMKIYALDALCREAAKAITAVTYANRGDGIRMAALAERLELEREAP